MSPRTKKANQQILEERREQILLAALKVFAKRGLAATKISDIASAAGLSHGLIYHYFKTKDDMFTELVKRAYDISLGTFEYVSILNISPLEKIRTIVDMIVSNAYQGEEVYYWYIVLQARISEAIPEGVKTLIEKNLTSYNDLFVPIIIEGQKLGQIVQYDPIKLATAYYSLSHGIAIEQMMAIENLNYPISLPSTDIVMSLFKNPERKEEVILSQLIKYHFVPVQLTDKHLIYRFRKSSNTEFTNFKSTMSETVDNGIKAYRIESEYDGGEKIIALIKAENLQPIVIELQNSRENSVSKIEYNNNVVTFDSPARKLYQKANLNGEYYDNYTLQFVLRGFPFDSNEIIKFTSVLDGAENTPTGQWEMEVRKIGTEKVQVPAGEFDCYKLEMGIGGFGISGTTAYSFYLWYTIDEPRFLVKYEYALTGLLSELVKIV